MVRDFPLCEDLFHHHLEGNARHDGRIPRGDPGQATLFQGRVDQRAAEARRVLARDRNQILPTGGKQCLKGTVFTGLRPDALHIGMRGQSFGRFGLGRLVVPHAIVFGDNLDLRILAEHAHRAIVMAHIHRAAGNAADHEDLALAFHFVGQPLSGVFAKARTDIGKAVGAGFGDVVGEHEHFNAGFAAFLDGPVQTRRRNRERDDPLGAIRDHAFVGGNLGLHIHTGNDLDQFDLRVIGRRFGQSLDHVGSFAHPRIAGIAEAEVDFHLFILRKARPGKQAQSRGCRKGAPHDGAIEA